MREGKIQLEEPPEGLIKVHENEAPIRIKIERRFYRQCSSHSVSAVSWSGLDRPRESAASIWWALDGMENGF